MSSRKGAAPGDGRWALVTGASSGIGMELARILAREGYDLVITARRRERLEELASSLRELYGVRAEVVQGNLAEPGGAQELYSSVREK